MKVYSAFLAALCASTAITPARAAAGQPASLQSSSDAGSADASVDDSAAADLGEIIVTAQKRSERLNDVPLSISAASEETLARVGVTDTGDLAKIAPGFIAAQTATAVPVYSIRGIGYYDSAFAATPAVTVYVDQVPLAYPLMTRNAVFDLERVEVLKGPQGTLFGQNSTGGAVNYIAAKPTDSLEAGVTLTAGRFDQINGEVFVSGPLGTGVSARLAVGHDSRGDWQRSYTRPSDTRGEVDVSRARLQVLLEPSERISIMLGASGWIDKSDTQAPQFIAKTSNLPQFADFLNYPLAPRNARAADWTPGFRKARDDSFYQLSMRGDFELSDALTLTSITSFAKLKVDAAIDADGTALDIDNYVDRGKIRSFNQEVRLQAELPTTRIVVGGNFSDDRITQNSLLGGNDSSTARNTSVPGFPIAFIRFLADQDVRTVAAFANVEQKLTDELTLQGGVRYTKDKRSFSGCLADVDFRLAPALVGLANFVLRPALGIPGTTVIPPNDCVTLDEQLNPGLAQRSLSEDNVSFRFGPNWKVTPDTLLYANISKGYKAGTFPTVGGVTASQFDATTQESVLGYEAGFKTALAGRKLQLSAAAFYYDYKNKQLLGTVIVPILGPLQKLVNVPKSRIYGAELQVIARPLPGLDLNGGITYVNSRVTGSFVNFNPYGTQVDFDGESFPFTPKWQATLDAQYTFPVSADWNAFVGGNVLYNSSTVGAFGAGVPYDPSEPQHRNRAGQTPNLPIVANALDIDAYTLLDLRVGVESADGRLAFSLWGRNVTNAYYWTNATFIPADTTNRFAGMPRTFGATLRYRYGQ